MAERWFGLLGTATKTEDQVKSRLLLDVVIRKSSSVFKLFTSEDKTLLVWWNTFFVLNLFMRIENRFWLVNLVPFLDQSGHQKFIGADRNRKSFPWISKNYNYYVIVTSYYLNFSFDIFDSVRSFNFQSDCLSSECLDEDLHTTTKTKDQVKGWFLLDVVIRKGSTIFELLTGEDKTLLIWWDTFLVLKIDISRLSFDREKYCSLSMDTDRKLPPYVF